MGHFSVNCAISHLPIRGGDEAVLIILSKRLSTPYNGINHIYQTAEFLKNTKLEELSTGIALELKEKIDAGEGTDFTVKMYEKHINYRKNWLEELTNHIEFWFGEYDSYGRVEGYDDDKFGDVMDKPCHFFVRRDIFDWIQKQDLVFDRETPFTLFDEAQEGMGSIVKLITYMFDMRIPFGYGIHQFGAQDPEKKEYQMNLDKAKFIASICEGELNEYK